MRKSTLQDGKMSAAAIVDQAAGWARTLTQAEARGPGDMENAWRRLEARYGVPWRTFWALRYRRPRDLTVSIYQSLAAAYAAECERQMRRLRHEIATTKIIAGADHAAVRAAETLVGEGET
jgi:hypothetical protein